jgi:hypothetical protein
MRRQITLATFLLASPLAAQVAGPFTFLGPSNMGGRMRAVVFHPTDPNVGWAGAVGGGVWKTTNGGSSWFAVGDKMTNLAVTTLAVDPTNPNVVYAGTGDRGYFHFDAVPGNGVHKSTDGGLTWTHLLATDTQDFIETNEVALNPAQPSHLYAATWTGVFRSTDAGATWIKVYGPVSYPDCRDVALQPGSSADVVLASCLYQGSNVSPTREGTIVRNPDAAGAGSFSIVRTETDQGRANLVFAPSAPSTVYALVSNRGAGNDQSQVPMLVVLKSTDAGVTWAERWRQDGNETHVGNLLLSLISIGTQFTCTGGLFSSYVLGEGNDKNMLVVDPVNANRLWAGGKDLFRSTDGGATWTIAGNSKFAGQPPWGHYAAAFPAGWNGTSSQSLWIASETGLYRSTNAVSGATTTDPCAAPSGIAFARQDTGIGALMLNDGAVQTGGATYFGASRRARYVKGTDAGGANGWTSSGPETTQLVLADPSNASIVYGVDANGGTTQKSTDGGSTWSSAESGLTGTGQGGFGMALDPAAPSRLWTGRQQMFRSTNAAGSWQAASTSAGYTTTNGVVAPSDPNRVVATAVDGGLALVVLTTTSALSASSSTAWTAQHPQSAGNPRHALAIDPFDPDVLWIAHRSEIVQRSTDFGVSWTTRAHGLPNRYVSYLLVDPSAPGHVFAGTDEGVYSTTDDGLHWTKEPGIPSTFVSRLALDGRKLFAFTAGRGAWRANLATCDGKPKGDANADGKVDVNDVFFLINGLFAGGAAPVCSANVNGDGQTDVSDVFYLINYLFAGGAPPH